MDLFPDYNRTTPFGVGTSIVYNYLDYRFLNTTTATYQLVFTMDDDYLKGYLYCDQEPVDKYHIRCVDEQFVQEGNDYYRCGKVIRYAVNKQTGIRHDERVLFKKEMITIAAVRLSVMPLINKQGFVMMNAYCKKIMPK